MGGGPISLGLKAIADPPLAIDLTTHLHPNQVNSAVRGGEGHLLAAGAFDVKFLFEHQPLLTSHGVALQRLPLVFG